MCSVPVLGGRALKTRGVWRGGDHHHSPKKSLRQNVTKEGSASPKPTTVPRMPREDQPRLLLETSRRVAPGIVGRRRGGLPRRHFVALEKSCGGGGGCGCCGGELSPLPFTLSGKF